MGDGLQSDDRELFARLYESLRRFASVVGPIEVEPDDLVHDALVRTLQRRRLSDLDDAGAYLRAAIVNLASNQRRRLGRQRRALARVADPGTHRDEYPSQVGYLLALSPDLRAALYLTEVEGWGSEAVGAALGCSAAAARQRVARARRQLRDALDEGEVDHA